MLFGNISYRNAFFLIILHFILGIIFNSTPEIATGYYYILLFIGALQLFRLANKDEVATIIIAYFTGAEVMFRMLHCQVPWEGGKYIILLFSLLGSILDKKKNEIPTYFWLYIIFLIPSIFIVEFEGFDDGRQQLSFNLSGPLSLFFAVRYFYNRVYSIHQLRAIVTIFLLPLFATIAIIAIRVPSAENLVYHDAANFQLSGGYGPNQVSSLLGFGVTTLIMAYFLNIKITGLDIVDRVIVFLLFFFCTINFSRGGVLTTIASVVLGIIVWVRFGTSEKKGGFILAISLTLTIFSFIFYEFDNYTGNALSKRYAGSLQEKGEVEENYGSGMSGREDIIEQDIELFKANPVMGVGPGMSPIVRYHLYDNKKPPHTEFSRLISEHGILGVCSLLVLVLFPILQYFSRKEFHSKLFLIMFTSFSIICSFHSAMRIGMMSFAYSISFIKLVKKREDTADPVLDYQRKSLMWQQYEERIS